MKTLVKSVAALSLAGALALAVATPSQAAPRGAWVGGAIVAGAIVGAAVANAQANAYYGPGPYGYQAYDSYGYAPGYEPYAPAYVPAPVYGPTYYNGYSGYYGNSQYPSRQNTLEGRY